LHQGPERLETPRTGGRSNHFAWDVKVFEHREHAGYPLISETIDETAIPMQRILSAMRVRFSRVKVYDPEGGRLSDRARRL